MAQATTIQKGCLRAKLILKEDKGNFWLEGEVRIFSEEKERLFIVKLYMRPGRMVILEDGKKLADVSTKADQPNDDFGKWAHNLMLELGGGAAMYYRRMKVGQSLVPEFTSFDFPPD